MLKREAEWKINEWTDQLYTVPQNDPYALAPGAKFTWTRLRAVGGRTLVWGRESVRFGPLDFKPKSLQDGFGEDWPITYDDIALYYDKTETLIGVSGGPVNFHNSPDNKNSLPGFNARCGEALVRKGAAKLGIKAASMPLAVLSKRYDGRAPCHYCGACNFHSLGKTAIFARLSVAAVRPLEGKPVIMEILCGFDHASRFEAQHLQAFACQHKRGNSTRSAGAYDHHVIHGFHCHPQHPLNTRILVAQGFDRFYQLGHTGHCIFLAFIFH
ncbi:MAG: hypothetical protein ACRD20_04745 [Terriglobales bacterium]